MDITLSIVIVEYNSIQEILACVASLKKHIGVPFEVIVSSNSCYSRQQQEAIDRTDANVRWLFNARNGGFAYAMNEGLKVARGRYLAIMNPDCTLCSDIGPMVRFMDMHPEVGAIAPQMKDGGGNIQDTARPYVTLSRYIVRQIKRIVYHKVSVLSDTMDYTAVQTVDWLIGAFMVCPYTDATQSGVIMSAFAFNKPVIATDVGGLPEMVKGYSSGATSATGTASATSSDIPKGRTSFFDAHPTLLMRGPSGRCGRRGMFAAVAATAVKKESNPPHPLLKKKAIHSTLASIH